MPPLPSQSSLSSLVPRKLHPLSRGSRGPPSENGAFASALSHILQSFRAKWPLPLPYLAAGLISAVAVAIRTWVWFDLHRDVVLNPEARNKDPKCQGDVYDYVVVGGGTAGMIVATRLANASQKIRVLLLEQGGEPSIFNEIPGMFFLVTDQPANTFLHKSEPQEHCCQNAVDQKAQTPRGKMLGGTSNINYMMFVRGHREDFNGWAQEVGDEGWNYEHVLPYFKKLEDYNGAHAVAPDVSKFHGRGGLLNVGTSSYMPGVEDFLAAGVEKGYPVADYNGENQEDLTVQNGWRESSYRAYYRDTGKPGNLCIKKYAEVTKINLEDPLSSNQTPKAVGVSYQRHNVTATVTASREVILSAGVFRSPKLLLLSGIGPAEDLEPLGIPVWKDLPVGENLQDHLGVLVGPFLKSPAFNPIQDINLAAARDFVTGREGILAGPASIAGTAFFQSPVAQPAYPDIQVVQFAASMSRSVGYLLSNILGIKPSVFERWFHPRPHESPDARFMILLLGRPKSTGYLSLSSADPHADLVMDPQYLSHPEDREALVWATKKLVDLFENTTALNTPLFPTPVPGCELEPFKSDSYYSCLVKYMSASFYQFSSSCAMGQVVDNKLRVIGVEGLRVVDASVMPRIPNGNTQASTMMIGEKGADLIISDFS